MGHNPIQPPLPRRLSADERRDALIDAARERYALGYLDLPGFERLVERLLIAPMREHRPPPRPLLPARPTRR